MRNSILILTEPGDIHAYAVALTLREKGASVVLWNTPDFPQLSLETVRFEATCQGEICLVGPDFEVHSPSFDVVWRRRPSCVLDATRLDPADRAFAESECYLFRRGLFDVLAPEAFWVNRPEAAALASSKIAQHRLALAAGLKAPATLYTNDPAEIRSFIRRHGGSIVYKPFRAVTWQGEETLWTPYTTRLTERDLVADELLRPTPGIYQELVPKAFEVRSTFIGDHSLSAKILSQATQRGKLDWRKSYDELAMEPFELPAELAASCLDLMGRLGLVFGCFDFIVTPAGEFVFLEVNEMGQFLFVEHYAEVPILDAFSEFLLQGRRDFQWDPSRPRACYDEVYPKALSEMNECAERHVTPPNFAITETA